MELDNLIITNLNRRLLSLRSNKWTRFLFQQSSYKIAHVVLGSNEKWSSSLHISCVYNCSSIYKLIKNFLRSSNNSPMKRSLEQLIKLKYERRVEFEHHSNSFHIFLFHKSKELFTLLSLISFSWYTLENWEFLKVVILQLLQRRKNSFLPFGFPSNSFHGIQDNFFSVTPN